MRLKNCFLVPLLSVVLLTLLFALLPFLMGLFFRDEPLLDDSELSLPALTIPEEENAYFDLKAILGEVSEETDEEVLLHLSGEKWDAEFVEETLVTYATGIEGFERAAGKAYFQDPDVSGPRTSDYILAIPDLLIMDWVRLSNLKALSLMKEGKEGEALEQAFLSVKLGEKMAHSYGPLISVLIGQTVQKIGLETFLSLAPQVEDAGLLKEYDEKLASYAPDRGVLAQAYNVEYLLMLPLYDAISDDPSELDWFADNSMGDEELYLFKVLRKMGFSFYYHPNETKNLYYQTMKSYVEAVPDLTCESKQDFDGFAPDLGLQFYFTENAMGLMVFDALLPRLVGGERLCEAEALFGEVQLKLRSQ